ncbi:MAG: single-stranded-DNA-specific exonuclease RecJ [Candidatus Xenobiia bacterium LiM19]
MEGRCKWLHPPKGDASLCRKLREKLGILPVTSQLLINREITDADEGNIFLHGSIEDLHDPSTMKGLTEAVILLEETVREGKKIRIMGDYDVDGVTSTATLLSELRNIGASVDYYIPHRRKEGYGLSREAVVEAEAGDISLIITVDCGISDYDAVTEAKSLGMKVIILDHHEVPECIPPADVVVNPKSRDCSYRWKELPAVGIAFKFVQLLRTRRNETFPIEYLDLLALGIIADSVPLRGENRIMVKEGLKRLSSSPRPGIAVLHETACPRKPLDTWAVVFCIAPRLNAAGRMEKAGLAVELLLSEDRAQAKEYADQLETLNRSRQKIEEGIRKEIQALLEADSSLSESRVIVLASERWHQGVLGITASRISHQTGKPVFLIALENGTGKGSARGVQGVSIYEMMSGAQDLLSDFGGHTRAGGFVIEEDNISSFRERLQKIAEEGDQPRGEMRKMADMEIALSDITFKLMHELELFEPFGEGNESPLFAVRNVSVDQVTRTARRGRWGFFIRSGEHVLKGFAAWPDDCAEEISKDRRYDILLSMERTSYQGYSSIVVNVHEHRTAGMNAQAHRQSPQRSSREGRPLIIDSRSAASKMQYIKNVISSSPHTLIVVRTPYQMLSLESQMKREQIPLSSHAAQSGRTQQEGSRNEKTRVALPHTVNECEQAPDVIFLYPPPSLLHFSCPFYRKTERIHFLFNSGELEFEQTLQNTIEPTLEKLTAIRDILQDCARRGQVMDRPERIAEQLKDSPIKKVTVELALQIFRECDICERKSKGYVVRDDAPLSEQTLRSSRLFNSLLVMKQSFGRFKELYKNGFEELKNEIITVIECRQCAVPGD